MVRWNEIASRLNQVGFGTFAVGWTPSDADSTVARRVIRFLEDRRMLFNDCAEEDLSHCLQSAEQIRAFLTTELGKLSDDSPLLPYFRAMRKAAREFMDRFPHGAIHSRDWHDLSLRDANLFIRLGQVRRDIGFQVALIAARWEIDVEDDLSKVLPTFD
jgi:hypothetical protein